MEIEDFAVEVSDLDGLTVLVARGLIDMVSVPVLRSVLDDVGTAADVVIDCAAVLFIDSSGLDLLDQRACRQALAGGSLRLRNCDYPVRQVVELTGLIALFELDNGDGTPDLGPVAVTAKVAPVSCRGSHRETGAVVGSRPLSRVGGGRDGSSEDSM